MSPRKTATLNPRIEPAVKEALRLAAEREHRGIANLIEVLARTHGEAAGSACRPSSRCSQRTMDSKTLKAVINAGALKVVRIVAVGTAVHGEAAMRSGEIAIASTTKGAVRIRRPAGHALRGSARQRAMSPAGNRRNGVLRCAIESRPPGYQAAITLPSSTPTTNDR